MKILLLSHSHLRRDPRIIKQLRWLRQSWDAEVTTVGLGLKPVDSHTHFEIPRLSLWERWFGYCLLSPKKRFWYFFGRYLEEITSSIAGVEYDLLIVNELEYLGWEYLFRPESVSTPTYLDIHEEHTQSRARGPLESLVFSRYWAYEWGQCKMFLESRLAPLKVTTVAEAIAQRYCHELGQSVGVILNAPDWVKLSALRPRDGVINLVHHGFGTKSRGIEATIIALRGLPTNYLLHLVLYATRLYRLKIQALTFCLGLRGRVIIKRAVPYEDLASHLNQYDLAIIAIPPRTLGNYLSLPNKFFESVQARLAIVSGPNVSITEIVNRFELGVVSLSWKPKAIRQAIAQITIEDMMRYKNNAEVAAKELNSAKSKEIFDDVVRQLLGRSSH